MPVIYWLKKLRNNIIDNNKYGFNQYHIFQIRIEIWMINYFFKTCWFILVKYRVVILSELTFKWDKLDLVFDKLMMYLILETEIKAIQNLHLIKRFRLLVLLYIFRFYRKLNVQIINSILFLNIKIFLVVLIK